MKLKVGKTWSADPNPAVVSRLRAWDPALNLRWDASYQRWVLVRHAQGRDHAVLMIQDPKTKKFRDPDFYLPWIENWLREMDTWRVREWDDHVAALRRVEAAREKRARDDADDMRHIARDNRRQLVRAYRNDFENVSTL